MKWIARITFVLIAVTACITVIFVKALKPASGGAFLFFVVWLLLPHAVMSARLFQLRHKSAASVHWYVVAALVSLGGIVFLADVIFWRPDAQGAIAVLMTPILQGGASALLLPVVSWVSQHARA